MMKIKKIVFIAFTVGLLFCFTGCLDILNSVLSEMATDVEHIYLVDSSNQLWSKYSSSDFYAGDKISFSLLIQFKEHYNYDEGDYEYYTDDSTEISLESSDEDIATVCWSNGSSEKKTFYCESYKTGESKKGTSFYVNLKSAGTVNITIKADDVEMFVITLNVNPEKTVTLDTHSLEMIKGSKTTLTYTNTYDNNAVSWSSNKTSVASVDTSTGEITAKAAGTATITVKTKTGSKSDSCAVTVVDPVNWKVEITNKTDAYGTLYPGEELQMECLVSNVDSCFGQSVHWISSNGAVVSVNENGLVKTISEGTAVISVILDAYQNVKDSVEITVLPTPVPANQFFWGNWIRMDNGKTYEVQENHVSFEGTDYRIESSTESELVVENLGTFTKDSESVIKWKDTINEIDIPFFRQGGTNLEYKVRVVGFEDEISATSSMRAAGTSTSGKSGAKVKAQSEKYSTYTDEDETDEDGYVELEAPVQGDIETLTVDTGDEIIVVPGLKIENDGDNLGTIPVVGKNEYSLKITGTISDSDKTGGYLYGNDYKKYPLTLTITNISDVQSEAAYVSISCSNPEVGLNAVNPSKYGLDGIKISSMAGGQTKTIELEVWYGSISSSYVDVELDVRVTNDWTGRVWVDYVPLRFFAGDMPVTIATSSTEDNPSAALNGFFIYPDGNSRFFSIKHDDVTKDFVYDTIWIPSFGDSKTYKLVFSGATVTGDLENSEEMFYTVAFDTTTYKEIDFSRDSGATKFGENGIQYGNDSEKDAYVLDGDFEAYLEKGDIDFYSFTADSTSTEVHQD